MTFRVEHVIARQHDGDDLESNLSLSCHWCSRHKSSDLAGFDPATNALAPLFHPRRDVWVEHFEWVGLTIVGRTAVGRTTIRVLALNSPNWLRVRLATTED